MKFTFKAKNEQGDIKEGEVDAINQEAAVAVLQGKGFIPVLLVQKRENSEILKDITKLWEGAKPRDLAIFFRQLATLIEAKVAIVSSLQAIGEQMDNKFLKLIILEIIEDVEDGMPLSESLAKNPSVFSPLTISMIRAGEVSGNLQRSIMFIADNTEKNAELNSKLKGAMLYPAFVLIAALAIGFGVFTFVMPKLTGVFTDLGIQVPWYTAVLMAVGAFMSVYWWLVLILILGFFGGLYYYYKTETGRREFHHIILKLPVMGTLFRYIYISRFAENLSVLLAGGIPVVRALVIVSEVVDNVVYESVILRAADEVKTGGSMSGVFAQSKEFPPIVSRMIKIGEDSGKIDEVLRNVADFYGRETDRITRNFTSLIEPVMIVGLGIGVALLVFAILVPIYTMSSQIQ